MLLVVMKLLVAQEGNNINLKLRKTPIECFKLLKEVYGEDVMLRMQIFKWHKHLEKGHKEMEDDSKTGQPSTTRTGENITKVITG